MRKETVSIKDARKLLNKSFALNVYSGWAGTTEQFVITDICRSKIVKSKIDIKGKNLRYLVTEEELRQLMQTNKGRFERHETVDGCKVITRVKLVPVQAPVKTVKLTLFGGFHNSDAINVIIKERDYKALVNGDLALADTLSPTQRERLDRHFCGIDENCCGGVCRASWKKANS